MPRSGDIEDKDATAASGLTYSLRVGTGPGLSDILAPMSCIGACGGSRDGYRQVVAMGSANHGLTASLQKLAVGTYYWSVQAVDHTYAGSPWAAEGSFMIKPVNEYYLPVVFKNH
jgi:hypothetical protein